MVYLRSERNNRNKNIPFYFIAMFEYEIGKIRDILQEVLGSPKNEPYSSGWQSYNCPYCAENEGVESDGKYNLETNVEHGCIFHCWKCEARGKLSKLIKDFGNEAQLMEYRETLNTIRNSQLYQLGSSDNAIEIADIETYVTLPKEYKSITADDKHAKNALEYLRRRGITDEIIERYKIGYTGYYCEDFTNKNRIIIPSYDEIGELNYYVGRDYTGRNKIKYCNPKISKTNIVFNVGMINWYENITLVEGPFDHIVVPNSIPLLGKTLSKNSSVFKVLSEKSKAQVNIMLDDDATENAYRMYKFLYKNGFKGRVRIIESPQGYDASLMFERYGKKGIIRLLRTAKELDEFTLMRY